MCDYCAWIEKLLRPPRLQALPTVCANLAEKPIQPVKYDRAILVHGTADSISSREEINVKLGRIENAATDAYKELAKGCESADAVELAIRHLENEGPSTDLEGNADMSKVSNVSVIRDASMMDSDCKAGSVGAVTGIPHPITLAKEVMQKTDHVLIVESGVQKLLSSPSRTDLVGQVAPGLGYNSFQAGELEPMQTGLLGTTQKCMTLYGAIARDRKGRMVCGVSTIDNREDSIARSSMSAAGSVLGCGIFADAKSCCSVSGEDRAVYVYAPARKIIERLKQQAATTGDSVEEFRIDEVLDEELSRFFKQTGESCVGAAVMGLHGPPRVAFKSHYFPWAYCSNGVITSGCINGEVFTKSIEGLDMPLDCECH